MTLIVTPPAEFNAPVLKSHILMHFDGTPGTSVFTDEKNNITFTGAYSAYSSTLQKLQAPGKFGPTSVTPLPFSGGYLTAPAQDLFGAGDFTLDFWFQINELNVGTRNYIFTAGSTVQVTQQGARIGLYVASKTGVIFNALLSPNMSIRTWHMFRLTKTGSILSAYLNQDRVLRVDMGAAVMLPIAGDITLFWLPAAGINTTTQVFPGWIDEFRVVRGESASFGDTITLPDAAWTD